MRNFGPAGPDPCRVNNLPDLARELGLLQARAAAGTRTSKVSLAELTHRLGLPSTQKSTIHAYVTGSSLAPSDVLDQIIIALGATPAEQHEWGEAWYRVSASRRDRQRQARPEHVPKAEGDMGASEEIPVGHSGGQRSRLSHEFLEILDGLADAIRIQWETEEQIRRINDPFPIPISLSNAPENIMDHWENIQRATTRNEPIEVDCSGLEIFDLCARVPTRRVVILGAAGSGKTILTFRYVLDALARRTPGSEDPVPVIFSIGSWNPVLSSLSSWMSAQLAITYPALAARDNHGMTTADRLLDSGLVSPVLDGFDEIGELARAAATIEINKFLRPRTSLLLTSRPEEYTNAINYGDVITGALVLRIRDLTVHELATYLPLTARRVDDHGSRTKWHPVLQAMRKASNPAAVALAEALSTPLMVALARTSFSDTRSDPMELLQIESTNVGSGTESLAQRLEDYLLDGFVPAVYSQTEHDARSSSRGLSRRADEVISWLRFLAKHMNEQGGRDFAWWNLHASLSRVTLGLFGGIAIAAPIFLMVSFAVLTGQWPSPLAPFLGGAAFAMMSGIGGGLLLWGGYSIQLLPLRVQLRVRRPRRSVLRSLLDPMDSRLVTVAWFATWGGGGFIVGYVSSRLSGPDSAPLAGLLVGLAMGTGIFLLIALLRLLGSPIDFLEAIVPRDLLAIDRRTSLGQGLIIGVGGSTICWALVRVGIEPVFGIQFGRAFPPASWIGAALITAVTGLIIWITFFTTWGRWLIARFWLPLRGRLPWSLMDFLEDAHHRGVLRRSGAVYQFRHARLQDRLSPIPPTRPFS